MMSCTDLDLLYRIANKYYFEGLSQQQISVQENISRPHVSRLLTKAKDIGIVKIEVSLPDKLQIGNLETQVCEKLKLRAVRVAKIESGNELEVTRIPKAIASLATNVLQGYITNNSTVGVGWGMTIYQTSLELPKMEGYKNLTFVPLVGMSDETHSYLQNNVIVDRFAERFGARSYYTSVPALYESSAKKHQIEKERYERLIQWWNKLDLAIIGLGPRFKRGVFLLNEASDHYKRFIAESEVVGDILAHFFYANGLVLQSQAYYEITALPLSQLKEIKNVICLAGGKEKIPGIVAAAHCGYFSTLFTDVETAKGILEY